MHLLGVIADMSFGDTVVLAGMAVAGVLAWRSRRGDFYKSVAEEKTAESEKLRAELDQRRVMTDIRPIVDSMDETARALERHAKTTDAVFSKVADMNGSLRALTEAMKALADRLILDEAARALLEEAGKQKSTRETR